jgi:serine/threonine protein kinase
LFTREKPFKGDIPTVLYKLIHEDPTPPSVVNPALPAGIDAIIRKALAKKPQDRYQTCEELRDALRAQAATLDGAAQTHVIPQSGQPLPNPITTRSLAATKTHGTQQQPRSERGAMVFMLLLLGVAGGVAGWGYQVKKKTGTLPPPLQKAVAYAYATAHTSNDLPPTGPAPVPHSAEPAASPIAAESQPETGNNGAAPNSATSSTTTDASPVTIAPANTVEKAPQKTDTSSAPPTAVPVSAQKITTPTSASVDPFKNQAASASQPPSPAPTSSASEPTTDGTADDGADAADAQPAKQTRRAMRQERQEEEQNLRVEGFSRADVPDLLRKADAAAGSGDYALARYEYSIVLRLDHRNAAARAGMARVIAARQERLQR